MRLLYIEDSPTTVRMVTKLLASDGHRVTSAPDVRAGLMLAIREKPDVILMDFDLPFVNGLDAVSILRSSEAMKQTPIVMVTASATDAEAPHFLERGCDAFVAKPVDKERLLKAIQTAIEKRSGVNG